MSYTYTAYLSINDTDGRSVNFSTAPTITVWDGRTADEIESPSPTLTNITVGLYAVEITLDDITDVLFKIVPDEDDEDTIADIKVIHEGYIEVVEGLGDTIDTIDKKVSAFIDPTGYQVTGTGVGDGALNGIYKQSDTYTYDLSAGLWFFRLKRESGIWKIYSPGPDGADAIFYTATNNAETPDLVDNWELGQHGELPLPEIGFVSAVRLAGEQGRTLWKQFKIVDNVSGEGALHILNENEYGYGQYNEGGYVGQYNYGTGEESAGQYNKGGEVGQSNRGGYAGQNNNSDTGGHGQVNRGIQCGQWNIGGDGVGQLNESEEGSTPVSGYDPAIVTAIEALVNAIKGEGWTDETLVTLMEAIEAISGGGGGGDTAEQIWNYASRTLTASPTDISTLAKTTDLLPLAKTTDIPTVVNIQSGLAKTTDLSPLAKTSELPDISNLPTKTEAAADKADILEAIGDIEVDTSTLEEALEAVKDKTDQLVFADGRVNANAIVDLDESDFAKQSTVEQILAMFAETPVEIVSQVAGGKITAIRGNDWHIIIPCEMNEDAKITLAVKSSSRVSDEKSLIFVDTENGLLYLDGVAAAHSNGGLAYADGKLTFVLKAVETAKLKEASYRYGIQQVSAAGMVDERYGGNFVIVDDIVRALE